MMTAIPWCSARRRPVPRPPGQAAAEYDVAKLLEQLPEPYRRVVVLFYLEDRSCEEVGELLSMPTGTVKALLHRGRKNSPRSRARRRSNHERQARNRSQARSLAAQPGDGTAAGSHVRRRLSGRASRPKSSARRNPRSRCRAKPLRRSARWLFVINVLGVASRHALLVRDLRLADPLRRWTSANCRLPEISAATRRAAFSGSAARIITLASLVVRTACSRRSVAGCVRIDLKPGFARLSRAGIRW